MMDKAQLLFVEIAIILQLIIKNLNNYQKFNAFFRKFQIMNKVSYLKEDDIKANNAKIALYFELTSVFPFNEQWELLMHIVEQIEKKGYETIISKKESPNGFYQEMSILKNNKIVAETLEDLKWINNAEKYSKFEAVYQCILNFLENKNI